MKVLLFLFSVLFACVSEAQTNYGLSFNGTNQYVSIGSPLSNNTSYTKEAWVYSTTNTGSRNIISSSNSPFWFNNGILSAGHGGNTGQVVDATAFPLNKWTHVAVTYDAASTTMKLYRDGTLISTNAAVASNYASQVTYIGSSSAAAGYLQGSVDEVRIWNVARTQTELKHFLIRAPSNTASGLASYHKLNNGSGTTSTNSTGGTNGTLVNTPGWVLSPVSFVGNALNFDGTDDVVTAASNSTLNITSSITLEAWVYATKNSGIQNVVSKSSQSINTGYIFPRTDNGWTSAVMYLYIGGNWRTLSAPFPSLNAWHHLAATYDGANMRIYVNGVLSATQAQTGAIATNTNVLALGNQPGYSEYFGGSVDEVRIWNIARTGAQILADKNKVLEPSVQTGLVTYYTFDQGLTGGANAGMSSIVDLKNENNGTLTNFALTGSSSNFLVQNAVLPVRWLNFSARENKSGVRLDWSTASEQHTAEFIVQHSVNGLDFSDVGSVVAAGNSDVVSRYQFLHSSPAAGINYYRLLQADIDGRSTYSEVKTIKLSFNDEFVLLNNPVEAGSINIKLNKDDLVSLFSADGRLLFSKHFPSGVNRISVKGFVKGAYFIKTSTSTRQVIIK